MSQTYTIPERTEKAVQKDVDRICRAIRELKGENTETIMRYIQTQMECLDSSYMPRKKIADTVDYVDCVCYTESDNENGMEKFKRLFMAPFRDAFQLIGVEVTSPDAEGDCIDIVVHRSSKERWDFSDVDEARCGRLSDEHSLAQDEQVHGTA